MNSNDDGGFREGEPPFSPKPHADAPEETPSHWVIRYFWPLALGCLFSGCSAIGQVPPSTDIGDRALLFAAMFTGPFMVPVVLHEGFLESSIAIWQLLGLFGLPLIAVYYIKPTTGSAVICAIGIAFWFWSGFISVIYICFAG